jgi:hypothetical protein
MDAGGSARQFRHSSGRQAAKGIEHLGIQVEDGAELADSLWTLKVAGRPVLEEGETTCCYARSEKSWVMDPDGVIWETFHTMAKRRPMARVPARHFAAPAAPESAEMKCCAPQGKAEPAVSQSWRAEFSATRCCRAEVYSVTAREEHAD